MVKLFQVKIYRQNVVPNFSFPVKKYIREATRKFPAKVLISTIDNSNVTFLLYAGWALFDCTLEISFKKGT